MEKLYVIGVTHYDFTNQQGQNIKGNKLLFLKDNFTEHSIGQIQDTLTIGDELVKKVTKLPANYDVLYEIQRGFKGQAKIKLIGIELAEEN